MKKCLIVDDEIQNRNILDEILREYGGYEVAIAENGAQALDMARQNPPDLIVSDILMPVMDGYTLCREWKSDDTLKHIPFVIYTATYTDAKAAQFALSLGAERFILKPQDPEVLVNIVKEVLEEHDIAKQEAIKPLEEEMVFFRQYNEVLFKKLEKKMLDLETANQKLRILEEGYRLSFENVSDVIIAIDTDLNVLNISPSIERILGYKSKEFIGRPVSDLRSILTPCSFEEAMVNLSSVLKGATIEATIYELIARDETIKHGEISASPVMNDGKIQGVVAVARDITERKRAEERLTESEEIYRTLFQKTSNPILVVDIDGNYTSGNRAALQFLECTEEQLRSKNIKDTLPPGDHADESLRKIMHLWENGGRIDREYFVDGKIKVLDLTITPCIWNGRRSIIGLGTDITNHKQSEQKLKKTLESLRKAINTTIQLLVSAVERRDPYTAGHQSRSAELASAIAAEMGLPPEQIEGIRMACLIHDIGKLSIPAEILSRPTKLSEIEFRLIKEHPAIGHEILKDVESSWPLAEMVYQHHERMDGSGYPRNLKGEDILIEARIMAVADVVESMASHRPYRPALGINAAIEEIEKNKKALYDADVVNACLKLFREKGFQLGGA